MSEAFLLARALLQFGEDDSAVMRDISAASITPDGSLWTASDELQTLERLTQVAPYVYGDHQRFRLSDYVPLADPAGEVDIEGMDYGDHYLWVTGSHSAKRRRTRGKNAAKDLARLSSVRPEPNRLLLARIPVVGGTLFASCSHPERPDEMLSAAALRQNEMGNALTEALGEDVHLGQFLTVALADKENGFNIEGLAVRGNRVLLGLRGPVLDGWAMLLELELSSEQPGVLTLQQPKGWSRPYRKHFLDLDGLGIREIQLLGDDLLILAGPTMRVEGAMKLFCLRDALGYGDDSLTTQEDKALELRFVLPFTLGADHAEGMVCLPCLNQEDALMILYDSPRSTRIVGPGALFADIFRIDAG